MSSRDEELKLLLKEIADCSIQLPDFQRDWVWDDNRIKSLIVSLANNYPVGAVMFLDTGSEMNFSSRAFSGVECKDVKPDKLVLDGQQRLTSILNAMYLKSPVKTQTEQKKKIQRFYYFNIQEISKLKPDWDEAIIAVNENKQITADFGKIITLDLSSVELECKNKYIPANIMFDEIQFSNWRKAYQDYYKENDLDNFIKSIDELRAFEDKVRNNIFNYRMPVISLSKETPKEAVCQVFENVNTGGVALNVFELVTAIFASDGYKLREDWENRKKNFASIKPGVLSCVSAADFLTTVTLYVKYLHYAKDKNNTVACKKKNVLELSLRDYKLCADKVEKAFIEAAKFLNSLNIFNDRDLPYSTQLIPLSATIAALEDKFHYQENKEKLKQWFWCGIFGELYGSANETRYALDITGLANWIINNDNKIPNTIERAYFNPCRLISLQTRNSAAYKGIIALILKSAKDFISGCDMDIDYFIEENIDIHHIFPKDYCLKQKIGLEDSRYNSIINKTPLSAKSNRMIGGNSPSVYLSKISKEMNNKALLNDNLKSHFIDLESIYNNDFDTYFINRAKNILNLIEQAMGKKITGLDSENVIKAYGNSLVLQS